MTYKIAPATGRTIQEMTDGRVAKEANKATEDDKAKMRAFGFTDAEALNAIGRFVTTSSDAPIDDVWDYLPSGVWYKAHELVSTLDADNADELVNSASQEAKSPKDFWKRLQSSLTEGEVDDE